MLGDYFDKNCADIHEELFRDLYISTLTKEEKVKMGECYVMKLNFAFDFTSLETMNRDFNYHINAHIERFCDEYSIPIDSGVINNDSASITFQKIVKKLRNKNFVVIIDEYDRSMNELLFNNTTQQLKKMK
jgi:hypothetical protein